MPDGAHIRPLLRVLSDSLLVPQSEDGRGREVIRQPLCSRHCAADFIFNTSLKNLQGLCGHLLSRGGEWSLESFRLA